MRRVIAALAGVGLLAAGAWVAARGLGRPLPDGPNVLVIVWDTVRADRTSLYGHTRRTTPWLERFAAEGVVFDRAISPAIWTPPSHGSMFTGFAPRHHGVKATYKWLDGHHRTLAERLRDAGYDTFAFSANPYIAPSTNLTQGFDTVTASFTKPWRDAAREATAAKLIARDRSTDVSPAWVGERTIGNVHPFKDAGPVAHQALAGWLAGRAEPHRPWFAFVNLMEAHIPRVPSMASRRALLDPDLIELGLATRAGQDELLAYTFGVGAYTDLELEAIRGVYDAALLDLDTATGAMMDDLRSRGLLDDTLVVLLADHGENLGDHHMFGHKFDVWDSLLRVPLVLWWPGRLAPSRVGEPVSTLGLAATVLDAAGLPTDGLDAPATLTAPPSGDPLVSELLEATPAAIRRVDAEHGIDDPSRWFRTFVAIEQAGDKLIVGSDGGRRLFRPIDDPGETEDRAAVDPERVAALAELLAAWEARTPVWDPARREHDADRPTVDPRTAEMLEQLGYVDDALAPPR